ncbi:MAG: hypothetical protein RIC56_21040 [Pseudomonadales bacterium]
MSAIQLASLFLSLTLLSGVSNAAATADTPDSVALRWLAKMAASDDSTPENSLFDFVVARLMDGGMPGPEAEAMATHLADVYPRWQSEKHATEAQVACENGQPRATDDDDAYRALDLADEVGAVVDQKYLLLTQSAAGNHAYALTATLEELKKGIDIQKIPSSDFYSEAIEGTALTDLAYFCDARGI